MPEPKKVNKWVKFVGTNINRWKDIINDLHIDQIPFQYVVEVRYHQTTGQIQIEAVTTADNLRNELAEMSRKLEHLSAIEFVIDIDKINEDIGNKVKGLIQQSDF